MSEWESMLFRASGGRGHCGCVIFGPAQLHPLSFLNSAE